MKQKIRIGHSPDPDDAFMFYALAKGKIPTGNFEIEHVIEDIESLNRRALSVGAGLPRPGAETAPLPLEVTALSCHAYALLHDRYQLLPYGASVGEGYGPIVVTRGTRSGFRKRKVAVPGKYTTAFLVLQIYEPDFIPVFTPFDRIFETVKKGEADFGLLIHEGQLTYQEEGFRKVVDLGEWWKEKFDLPLPLGINAIRRDLGEETISNFSRLFKESLDYAMAHRGPALEYALQFGRGLDPKRGDRFVGMYVNDYSLDLGVKGRRALEFLFNLAWEKNLIPERVDLSNVEAGLKPAPTRI